MAYYILSLGQIATLLSTFSLYKPHDQYQKLTPYRASFLPLKERSEGR